MVECKCHFIATALLDFYFPIHLISMQCLKLCCLSQAVDTFDHIMEVEMTDNHSTRFPVFDVRAERAVLLGGKANQGRSFGSSRFDHLFLRQLADFRSCKLPGGLPWPIWGGMDWPDVAV